DQLYTQVDIVSKIAGMPYHWMARVATIEMLQAKSASLFLRIANNSTPTDHTISLGSGVAHARYTHTGKGDHVRAAHLDRQIDRLSQCLLDLRMIGRVDRARCKAMTTYQRNFETQLFNLRVGCGINSFDGYQSQVF